MFKLNYRDKIIAAVLIVIAVGLIGFFALIKPKYKDIQTHQKTLSDVQKTKADIEAKIKEIPGIKENIKKIHTNTKAITDTFVPVNDVTDPVVIDKYMQKFADDTKVKLEKVELAETKLAPISYYYQTTSDTLGEMRNSADIDGKLGEAYTQSIAESTAVSQRAKENIIQTQYGITIKGTKKKIWDYLKALKDFDKTVIINSVSLDDYTFGENEAKQKNVTLPESKDGEEVSIDVDGSKITNTSGARIVITLYSVYEMPMPDVDTVPSN